MTTPDIIGHEAVRERLRDAAVTDRLHHAYLFEGPPGVGKSAVAAWLTLVANCEAVGPDRPCGTCQACRTILAGNHPDVVHLEPDPTKASATISVAAVREVVRTVGYHRYSARRRFVVIDPAEAMQAAAANALLKTLEEPPESTGFVLLCTHADALLPTIVSRCQRVRFAPVDEARLTTWLTERGIEHPQVVARLAAGCPGRAIELAGGELQARLERRDALLDTLGGDLGGIFAFTEQLTRGGRAKWSPDADALLETLEDLLRDAVVAAVDAERGLLHADRPEVAAAWAKALWPGGVEVCNRAMEACRRDLRAYVSGKTALDALLVTVATELGRARTAGARSQR